jgi:hypothetical protein
MNGHPARILAVSAVDSAPAQRDSTAAIARML